MPKQAQKITVYGPPTCIFCQLNPYITKFAKRFILVPKKQYSEQWNELQKILQDDIIPDFSDMCGLQYSFLDEDDPSQRHNGKFAFKISNFRNQVAKYWTENQDYLFSLGLITAKSQPWRLISHLFDGIKTPNECKQYFVEICSKLKLIGIDFVQELRGLQALRYIGKLSFTGLYHRLKPLYSFVRNFDTQKHCVIMWMRIHTVPNRKDKYVGTIYTQLQRINYQAKNAQLNQQDQDMYFNDDNCQYEFDLDDCYMFD